MKKELKLIKLWYVDGNYNPPVETIGFKTLVKESCSIDEGYIYKVPNTEKETWSSYSYNRIFETLEQAQYKYNKSIEDRIRYAEDDLKRATEILKKYKK